VNENTYLLVQYGPDGGEHAAREIGRLDGVGRVSRVGGAYDLVVHVATEDDSVERVSRVFDAVLGVPGVLHVVSLRAADGLDVA